MKVYRWDLDKTYLDTDFHSLRGLVRTATEPAHRKRALPGAAPLLRALSHRPDVRVTVVSGSPTQMRQVLREKLAMDGIRFDELVLKDNVGNVRKGRIRAVRGQIGYKLPALLEARARTDKNATEVLFGDDVESDALIYSVYADAVAGRIGAAGVSRIMERAGAYPDEIDRALSALVGIAHTPAIERIFIRQERGVPSQRLAALGRRVVPVRSWWQAALVLREMGHIEVDELHAVMTAVYERAGEDAWAIAALAQDMLRRAWVQADTLAEIQAPEVLADACRQAVAVLGGRGVAVGATDVGAVDYLALLDSGAWSARGRAKK